MKLTVRGAVADQEALEPDMIDPVVEMLEEGIEAVKKGEVISFAVVGLR